MGFSLRHFFYLYLLALFAGAGYSQDELLETFLQQEQENNPESESALQELLAQPLDLNHTGAAELRRLPFLTLAQIETFLQQRNAAVYFENLDQALQALQVSGDTLLLCRKIFRVTSPAAPVFWQAAARVRVSRPATQEDNWAGSPYRVYSSFKLQRNQISAGILAEKDPGEQQFDDYRSFYVAWQKQTPAQTWQAVLGSYQIEWGLGLALWAPYGVVVTSDVHAAGRRWARMVRPYHAANESAALQGFAATARFAALAFSGFTSVRRQDVTLDDDGHPVRLRTTGYHRTATERRLRRNLQEKVLGASVKIHLHEAHEIGFLMYTAEFDNSWRRGNLLQDEFNFTGRTNHVLSVFAKSRLKGLQLQGEAARSRSGGAGVAAVLSSEERMLSWTAEIHHVEADFHSPRGRGFVGSDDAPQGEKGYSLGLRLKPGLNIVSEFFVQNTRALWRTVDAPLPPQRASAGALMEWKIRRPFLVRVRYRRSSAEELLAQPRNPAQTAMAPSFRESLRLELEQKFGAALRLRPRLDWARAWQQAPAGNQAQASSPAIAEPRKIGTASGLEVNLALSQRLSINARYTLFDTPTPLYFYERDVPGVFTVQALRESGTRGYIYWHLRFGAKWSLAGKIASTEPELASRDRQNGFAWALQLDWTN